MHCLLSSLGSAETQRGEVAVSGSRTPTFVFAGAALPAELPEELLLPQPASPTTSAIAAPVIATAVRIVVRIRRSFLIVGCRRYHTRRKSRPRDSRQISSAAERRPRRAARTLTRQVQGSLHTW